MGNDFEVRVKTFSGKVIFSLFKSERESEKSEKITFPKR